LLTDVFNHKEKLATRDLLEGSGVEDVIGTWHGSPATFEVAYIANVKLDFVGHIRIVDLVFVAHIVLFLFIA